MEAATNLMPVRALFSSPLAWDLLGTQGHQMKTTALYHTVTWSSTAHVEP